PGPSGLLHLTELEFDRGGTTKNQYRHAQAALLVIDFLDDAVEIVERAFGDANHLARFDQDLRLRLVDAILDAAPDRISLGILDQVPRLVVDAQGPVFFSRFDLHEHITREELAFAAALLATAHFDDFLGRHQDVAELVLHRGTRDTLLERARNLILESGIGVN